MRTGRLSGNMGVNGVKEKQHHKGLPLLFKCKDFWFVLLIFITSVIFWWLRFVVSFFFW